MMKVSRSDHKQSKNKDCFFKNQYFLKIFLDHDYSHILPTTIYAYRLSISFSAAL